MLRKFIILDIIGDRSDGTEHFTLRYLKFI